MTEHLEQGDGVRKLSERLKQLDNGIPVPESVKAPQLLARMERENAHRNAPRLYVVGPRWQKAAGAAAVFVLVMGGIWLARGWNGMGLSHGAALSSAPAVETAPMPAAQEAGEHAVAEDTAEAGLYAGSYAEVRLRLTALQGEEQYYTQREDTAPAAPDTEGQKGGVGGMGTGSADIGEVVQPRMGRSAAVNTAGASAADIVRVDGDSLYYLTVPVGERAPVVKIVDMNSLKVASTISLSQAGTVSELLVEDGMLAVLYRDEAFYKLPVYERQVEREPVRSGVATVSATVLEVFDVSDGTSPISTRKLEQQGDYVSAELADGMLSLVTDCGLMTNARNGAARDEELVPALRDSAASGEVEPVPAGGICLPAGATEDRYAVVSFVNVEDAKRPAQTKAVLGGAAAAHRSGTTLYVAGTFAGAGSTGILKFTHSGTALALAAEGKVPGYLANSDALDEWNGSLRAVTVTAGKMDAYTLDGALRRTGALALYGTPTALCFAGDALYLTDTVGGVTLARFSDPDGEAARQAGDTAGTAAHIYRLEGERALTLGYDTQKNLEAVLYDMSAEAPKRLQAVTLGGRGSTYFAPEQAELDAMENGLLALPVLLYNGDGAVFSGAVLLEVTQSTLTQRGRVEADSGAAEAELQAKGLDVRHGVVVEGRLITVSRAQAVSWALQDLAKQKTTAL